MGTGVIFRGMNQAELDAAYDSDAAVPLHSEIMRKLRARSSDFRREHSANLDLRYGPKPRNLIDLFLAEKCPVSILCFLHGGYWQSGAKEFFSALAYGPMTHGISVAFIGYTLAPEASLTEIVSEVRTGLQFLSTYFDYSPSLFLSGWSAGGHLAACCMDLPMVVGGISVSGIYDLKPIQLSWLNANLNLTSEEVVQFSPILNMPKSAGPLITVVGENELSGLRCQTHDYTLAREEKNLPGTCIKLEYHNHFTILDELERPDGEITKLILELINSATYRKGAHKGD